MNLPTVAPPTNVTASAWNAVVNLAWTASTTPGAKYDVYRAQDSPTAAYTKLNLSPLTATAYADSTAQNARTYYYYLVALDAALFESRVSHFNSDCAVSGPDCLTARPLNPNPPAPPSGVQVFDPETGARLNVSWTANPEGDIDVYTVRWGTTAGGPYPSSATLDKSFTSYSILGLTNNQTYYVVVTATNTSGHESAPSQQKVGTPTFVRGVRAPDVITSVHVNKSGTNDVIVSWTPITLDIYGKPATVSFYEIFRGTTPTFMPGPGNKIGQTPNPSFPDPGALLSAQAYHYLVRAVDASGNVGGLGNQLPNGIDLLTISKTPNGLGGFDLGLTWPAVTTDFDGAPLAIDHYEVYAASFRFTRTDVRNDLVPRVASPITASFTETAPAPNRYYSVIAVDDRGNKSPY
jgi:hypothetical protein